MQWSIERGMVNYVSPRERTDYCELTRAEFGLLKKLAEKPGQIFSRNQLMDTMYTDH